MRHSGGRWRAEFAIRAPNAPRKAEASELRCRSDVVCAALCKSDSAVVHGSAAGGLAANARPIGTRPRGWPEATPRRGLGLDADAVRVMLLMPETEIVGAAVLPLSLELWVLFGGLGSGRVSPGSGR
jgi:hypothetical protein